MVKTFTGGCLCGAVRFECSGEPVMTGHCHCEDCRRTSGTGHSSHMAVPEQSVALTGKTSVYDRPADSGNVVSRHFCGRCGAPVYSKNAAMPGIVFLRASTFDDLEVFKPQMHVYASRAPSWDKPQDGLPAFDLMPKGF